MQKEHKIWSRKTWLCTCLGSHQLCDDWEHFSGLLVHRVMATQLWNPLSVFGNPSSDSWQESGSIRGALSPGSKVISTWPMNPQIISLRNLDFKIRTKRQRESLKCILAVAKLRFSVQCGLSRLFLVQFCPHSAILVYSRILNFPYIMCVLNIFPKIYFPVEVSWSQFLLWEVMNFN